MTDKRENLLYPWSKKVIVKDFQNAVFNNPIIKRSLDKDIINATELSASLDVLTELKSSYIYNNLTRYFLYNMDNLDIDDAEEPCEVRRRFERIVGDEFTECVEEILNRYPN